MTSPRVQRSGSAADIGALALRAARSQTPIRDSQQQQRSADIVAMAVLPQPGCPHKPSFFSPGPLGHGTG